MRKLLTIAGPDGAGKTSVVTELTLRLAAVGPVERHHHRIGVLPRSATSLIPTERPHDQAPYGSLVSVAKILYLYAEWVLASAVQSRRGPNRHGWTVLERGWWDLLVDPRRYRLRPHPRLVEVLGWLRPGKGRVMVLNAPAEVLHDRKQELPADEITRQLALWRHIAVRHPEILFVDVDRPVDEVVDEIWSLAVIPDRTSNDPIEVRAGVHLDTTPEPERWIRLSARTHHWYLPTRHPAATSTSLLIHQPMRPPAQLAWRAARTVAATGALRAMPAHAVPSIHARIRPHIPAGGTAAISTRLTRRSGTRAMALTIDAAGQPHSLIKLADDELGRARLAGEVEAVEQFGPLLAPPVTTPMLLHIEPGLIVFEAVRWSARREPWRLDPELAYGMGELFAQGANLTNETGISHGDFAPWNVLKVGDGWSLIDWEDAGDGRPAFEDPFRYLAQACTLLGHPSEEQILEGLLGRGPVGEILAAYADGAGIKADGLSEQFGDFVDRTADWDPEAHDRLRSVLASHDRSLHG